MKIDTKRMLVVVDYQNDFITGSLGFEDAKKLDTGIAALIKEYLDNGDGVIFTMDTHDEDYLETQEGRNLPVKHCIESEKGWELYGEVGKLFESLSNKNIPEISREDIAYGYSNLREMSLCGENEEDVANIMVCEGNRVAMIKKETFGSRALGIALDWRIPLDECDDDKENGYTCPKIESITFVGVVTNMCVISNAVIAKATCHEAKIIIKKDLVDSFNKELHQKALDVMESMQMVIE